MVKIYRTRFSLCFKFMRITSLLIGIQACFATLLLAGSIKAQNINLDVKQADIKQVFLSIEKQSGVTFVYNEQAIRDISKISIKATNQPLTEVLRNISGLVPLQFKQSGNVIGVSLEALKRNSKTPVTAGIPEELLPPTMLSGKITDEKGDALPGVSIHVTGGTITTFSDKDGKFSITVTDEKAVLVFSYIGYKTTEITVGSDRSINMKMQVDAAGLDEVQVIAYGTTSQRLTTGTISKVGSADIEKQPVGNPLAALEGRVPGLIVTQSNGVPGSAFKVQLQGQNAFGVGIGAYSVNSSPLFIVDGIPFAPNNNSINQVNSAARNLSPFNSINPQDIESIEVLKDADATAIYGSRGAYGVILITTKKGKPGDTKVTVNVNSGFSSITREPDFLNTQQYLAMRHEAFKNDGVTPTVATAPDLLSYDTTKYTDWKKLLIGNTAYTTDAEASVTGGNENTQFLINGGYHHETTVLPGSQGDDRASFHFSLTNSSPDKRFHTLFSATYSADNNNILVADLTNLANLPPDYPDVTDASGKPVWQYKGVSLPLDNPLAYLSDTYRAKTNNLLSNLQLSYLLLPGLTVKTSLGYNTIRMDEVSTTPSIAQDPQYSPQGYAYFGNNAYDSYILEPQAEYAKNISKGKLDILAGGSWQQIINNSNTQSAYNYSSDNLLQSISAAGTVTAANQYSKYRYQAYFARINYNWDDRYIIDLTGRRDGSSRFGPGRQFANFGAIGGAWLFSNERIIKDNLPLLSFGKLRGSYGVTGSDQIGDYQYLDSWSSTANAYQGVSGLKPTRLYNPDYSWEVNNKLSVAIELGFLKDRIFISSNYYRNRSDNHLLNIPLSSQTGFTSVLENFPALVQNRGFEFVITTKNIAGRDFGWSTTFNLTLPQNKLLAFDNLSSSSYASYTVGQSLTNLKGFQYLGVDPGTGVFQFSTTTGLLGSLDPKFYGGLLNSFHYKGLSLDVFFEFRKQLGINYLSNIYNSFSQPGSMINEPVAVLSRWQNPGDVTDIQKFTATAGSAAQLAAAKYANTNTGSYTDASFIRLKNLYLSYNLPDSWIKGMKVKSSRIFIQGQNMLTVTHYSGSDPETQNINTLPPLKTLTAGIQLSF